MGTYRLSGGGTLGRWEKNPDRFVIYQQGDPIEMTDDDAAAMAPGRVTKVSAADKAALDEVSSEKAVEAKAASERAIAAGGAKPKADAGSSSVMTADKLTEIADGTVDSIKEAIADMDQIVDLQALAKTEKKGRDRAGVANAISERINELKKTE